METTNNSNDNENYKVLRNLVSIVTASPPPWFLTEAVLRCRQQVKDRNSMQLFTENQLRTPSEEQTHWIFRGCLTS